MAKIVNEDKFLEMPPNTLYREYEPYQLGQLYIKGRTLDDCYWSQSLSLPKASDWDEMVKFFDSGRISFDLYSDDKELSFQEGQLYLVYELEDVIELHKRIGQCLTGLG